jgi:hypothetical protein
MMHGQQNINQKFYNQGTTVIILTRRWDGLPGAPIPVEARYFSLLRKVHTGSRANPAPGSIGVGGS